MILWIDDDSKTALSAFYDELIEYGYKIKRLTTVDLMCDFLADSSESIDLIIMDIMMPYGTKVSAEDSKNGILTGLYLLKKIKSKEEYRDLPILIFTITNEPEVRKWAQDNTVPILRKQETLPDELLQKSYF